MLELQGNSPLEIEIVAERASAYFATTRRMERALKALAEFDQSVKPLHRAETARRDELVAEAAEQVWVFVIQREAMKLPYYDELFADFGIPEEVRRKMGPKDRTFKSKGDSIASSIAGKPR